MGSLNRPCWELGSRGGQGNLAQLWEGLVGEAGGLKDKDQGECGLSTSSWAQVYSLGNSKGRHVDFGGAYPGQHLCFWNAV